GDTPVFANTGVNKDNVADILSVADGVIIGTHLKVDGDTWKPVDPGRVKRFMEAVERAR
ncbi:MAG: SgcQ protein, partial [Alphaproteobacteria bacterium]|nr:SgcQ protein [Alphaproteobacteria bacterium]